MERGREGGGGAEREIERERERERERQRVGEGGRERGGERGKERARTREREREREREGEVCWPHSVGHPSLLATRVSVSDTLSSVSRPSPVKDALLPRPCTVHQADECSFGEWCRCRVQLPPRVSKCVGHTRSHAEGATHTLSLCHTYTLSLCHTHTHTHTQSLSTFHTLSLSRTHTHTHSHTHTHTPRWRAGRGAAPSLCLCTPQQLPAFAFRCFGFGVRGLRV